MAGELKSTLEIIMERFGEKQEPVSLSQEQKEQIAEIRRRYQAKMAEARILLKDDENLPRELSRLEKEMEEKIEKIRSRPA
ncbi:MAG: hypothetical protein WHX93_05580 [bacterium]